MHESLGFYCSLKLWLNGKRQQELRYVIPIIYQKTDLLMMVNGGIGLHLVGTLQFLAGPANVKVHFIGKSNNG